MRTLIVLLLLSWVTTSIPATTDSHSQTDAGFVVRLESWVLMPGQCLKYTITVQEVVVAYQNDYGVKLHEVFRSKLEPAQAERLHSFLRAMPLDTIDSEYVDSNVDDGFHMTFDIQVGQKPSKRVILQNQWQVDLVKLCREINRLVPIKYALRPPDDEKGSAGRGPNNRMQATAGALAVLGRHVGRAPAAPDAER